MRHHSRCIEKRCAGKSELACLPTYRCIHEAIWIKEVHNWKHCQSQVVILFYFRGTPCQSSQLSSCHLDAPQYRNAQTRCQPSSIPSHLLVDTIRSRGSKAIVAQLWCTWPWARSFHAKEPRVPPLLLRCTTARSQQLPILAEKRCSWTGKDAGLADQESKFLYIWQSDTPLLITALLLVETRKCCSCREGTATIARGWSEYGVQAATRTQPLRFHDLDGSNA